MTIYRPKYRPKAGYVADAVELQREFNRAERALREVDQHNFQDASVGVADVELPSGAGRSPALTHYSGSPIIYSGDYTTTGAWTMPTGADDETWLDLLDGEGDPVELAFVSKLQTVFTPVAEGAYDGGSTSAPNSLDVRLLVDGEAVDGYGGESADTAGGTGAAFGFHAEGRRMILAPGTHKLTVQVRERGTHGGKITGADIMAFGFAGA